MSKKKICLLPEVRSLGGPRTFQRTLMEWGRENEAIEFCFDTGGDDPDAYLVIGAPKKYLKTLLKARLHGIPVIQRLNGMNWIHRRRNCGLRYTLHSEAANLAIAFYRRFVCSGIVYQSPFCENRWNRTYGKLRKPQTIIYNGVNTACFFPPEKMPEITDTIPLLLVEGSFQHGMDFGLEIAADLGLALADRFPQTILLQVAGKTSDEAVRRIQERIETAGKKVRIDFLGVLDRESLAELERKAALLFSAEIHPACPNAVLEAMSCGLPVIGYDTGALKDVVGEGGIIVPYGTDPWALEWPKLPALIDAAERVIRENASFREAAKQRAAEHFTREKMIRSYLDFCLGAENPGENS